MYFKNNNNFLHGVNFHHFHDDKKHLAGQGSINKDDFNKIIKFIGRDNILNADEFCNRVKENKLGDNKVCFTFDDGSCTFNVANPCPTDLNGDGQTTTSDLLIFLGAFGTDCE